MLADCTDRKSSLRRRGVNFNAHNVELTKNVSLMCHERILVSYFTSEAMFHSPTHSRQGPSSELFSGYFPFY